MYKKLQQRFNLVPNSRWECLPGPPGPNVVGATKPTIFQNDKKLVAIAFVRVPEPDESFCFIPHRTSGGLR